MIFQDPILWVLVYPWQGMNVRASHFSMTNSCSYKLEQSGLLDPIKQVGKVFHKWQTWMHFNSRHLGFFSSFPITKESGSERSPLQVLSFHLLQHSPFRTDRSTVTHAFCFAETHEKHASICALRTNLNTCHIAFSNLANNLHII